MIQFIEILLYSAYICVNTYGIFFSDLYKTVIFSLGLFWEQQRKSSCVEYIKTTVINCENDGEKAVMFYKIESLNTPQWHLSCSHLKKICHIAAIKLKLNKYGSCIQQWNVTFFHIYFLYSPLMNKYQTLSFFGQ